MARLRAAILGYGRSGEGMHAGAIEALADKFEMVAACDIDRDRLTAARKRFGCAVYEDYHRMLADERLDLVCVITRSYQHAPMTCDCLRAGVNVLVTKPWAVNQAQAETMIAAAKASGKMLLPWLPARWSSDLRRLREIIATGAVGKVFLVRRVQTCYAARDDWQTETKYGGGYLLNWGPHLVDTAVQVVGGKVASAYGRLRHLINPGDGDDIFFAALTLADGTIVTSEYTVSAAEMPNWLIQGDGGTIVVRGREIVVHSGPPKRPADPTKYPGMAAEGLTVTSETVGGDLFGDSAEVYRAIAAALRGERPFPVTPADALELTRTLDAIRAADAGNTVVRL